MHYPAKLSPNGTGGYLVQFGDVKEALTEGASIKLALANAAEALETALLGRMKDGDDIPFPSKVDGADTHQVSPSAQAAAKLAFYEAFRKSGLTRTALARKIGKDEAEVRRMLDPYHATKLSALDDAIRAMGLRLTVVLEPA
jgi:antitoxin HicB